MATEAAEAVSEEAEEMHTPPAANTSTAAAAAATAAAAGRDAATGAAAAAAAAARTSPGGQMQTGSKACNMFATCAATQGCVTTALAPSRRSATVQRCRAPHLAAPTRHAAAAHARVTPLRVCAATRAAAPCTAPMRHLQLAPALRCTALRLLPAFEAQLRYARCSFASSKCALGFVGLTMLAHADCSRLWPSAGGRVRRRAV